MLKLFVVLILHFVFANCLSGNEDPKSNSFADNSVKLLDSKKYVLEVAEQFIHDLEDYGVCNTKLQDMVQKISRKNYFGYNVDGSVNYKNGFLSTFQEVKTKLDYINDATINQEKNTAYMSLDLIFSSLMMFYDYSAVLTEGNFSGTVAIPMNDLQINLSILKYFDNDTISHNIDVTSYTNGRSKRWYYEPSNHYTEIINKDITLSFDQSEKNIENLWNVLLGKAIDKVPFPTLCLLC